MKAKEEVDEKEKREKRKKQKEIFDRIDKICMLIFIYAVGIIYLKTTHEWVKNFIIIANLIFGIWWAVIDLKK